MDEARSAIATTGLRPGVWQRVVRAAARVRADLPITALDGLMVAAAYAIVLLLRFDGSVPPEYWRAFRMFLPAALAVHLGANALAGLYGRLWAHAGVDEARRVVLAGGAATCLLSLTLTARSHVLPASVVVLGGAIAVLLVGALRFHARLLVFQRRHPGRAVRRVVVVGAGNAGATIIHELQRDRAAGLEPVAVLDQDPKKHGRALSRVPVLGGLEAMCDAVTLYGADEALFAIPSATSELVRATVAAADAAGIPMKILPTVRDLVGGELGVRDIRQVEITDLLGRDQVDTDLEAVRAVLEGRRVLITGAGGSIGSEIARQVSLCGPAELLLLDRDETLLHDAAATVSGTCQQVLADIRERARVEELFARHRPEIVFHAAALKHVPLLEAHPHEAVRTNVFGTRNVIEAAATVGVERFVFISSDKAVRPKSVMGASKRLGEQLLLNRMPASAAWCAVRFGNVLGSRGSVIPTFQRQIAQGGPVTVTDPRMTRFFMSIPEAVALVLQAGSLARGSEVFMLDMGEPVRIVDLAERMIRLTGRRVGVDVAIEFTGPRPGEKLHEELHAPDEPTFATPHPSILRMHPRPIDVATLDQGLARLRDALGAMTGDPGGIARLLHELVAVTGVEFRLRRGELDPAVLRQRSAQGRRRGLQSVRAGDHDLSVISLRRSFDGGSVDVGSSGRREGVRNSLTPGGLTDVPREQAGEHTRAS